MALDRLRAGREAFDLGCEVIIQTNATLAELANAVDVEIQSGHIDALAAAILTGRNLVALGGNGSVEYLLGEDSGFGERAKTAGTALVRAEHSLRILRALYWPQAAPAICEGGC